MRDLKVIFDGGTALIPFVMAGDPDLETTVSLVEAMVKAGADAVELGMPFSDPLADGPVIQEAGQRALACGTTLESVVKTAGEIAGKVAVPIILMGYFNPIMSYGVDRFASDLADAGVAAVIVPDLPFDEGDELHDALRAHGVTPILMVSPNIADDRLAEIGRRAEGFVYCVSLLGVTGQGSLHEGMASYIERVRRNVSVPLALGFGIDGPERAAQVAPLVDGVVVGSAVVKVVHGSGGGPKGVACGAKLIGEIASVIG